MDARVKPGQDKREVPLVRIMLSERDASYPGNALESGQRIAREVAAFLDDEFEQIRRAAFGRGDGLLDGADNVGRLLDAAGGEGVSEMRIHQALATGSTPVKMEER